MGIGAMFGAMNTMYALVSARTREIGTLRALGFSRMSILSSFMIESAFLALVGGLLGSLLALPINTLSGATGGANFSQVAFDFRVSPTWLGIAVAGAVVMGLVGGFLPAWRAATHADHGGAARRVITYANHRDTENTEDAQRLSGVRRPELQFRRTSLETLCRLRDLCVSVVGVRRLVRCRGNRRWLPDKSAPAPAARPRPGPASPSPRSCTT